jgi:hypothetical protein
MQALRAIRTVCGRVFDHQGLDERALAYVADETVQVYGGYGYSQDYPAERTYRDARITRIYEGTNEINRVIIPTRLLKSAAKGEWPFETATGRALDEAMNRTEISPLI